MHRLLRDSLVDAEGHSDLVIVIFLDVRGFSSFAGMAESSEAAIFLRRMYIEILDSYFPDSVFFKPTGDGLMIIRHFDKDTLSEKVTESIVGALNLVAAFPTITSDDPMVNFSVPESLGIGIARGAATRLQSGDLTLDYSGRPLNLAARLMDLARPRGVVFDARLIKGLDVSTELLEHFSESDVYLKGIADLTPLQVFASKDASIPDRNRRPLEGVPYETPEARFPFKDLAPRNRFIHRPPVAPIDPGAVELLIMYPKATASGGKSKSIWSQASVLPEEVRQTPSGWELTYDYAPSVARLKAAGVKSTWEIRLVLRYMVARDADAPA